jgi:hypothetical protein
MYGKFSVVIENDRAHNEVNITFFIIWRVTFTVFQYMKNFCELENLYPFCFYIYGFNMSLLSGLCAQHYVTLVASVHAIAAPLATSKFHPASRIHARGASLAAFVGSEPAGQAHGLRRFL